MKVLDVLTGPVVGHARPRKKADGKLEAPGNLLFFEGDVLSQSVAAVTAYPQLEVKLQQITELLKNNPNDPRGLTERERGELRAGATSRA